MSNMTDVAQRPANNVADITDMRSCSTVNRKL